MNRFFTIIILVIACSSGNAQTTESYAVQCYTSLDKANHAITLHWKADPYSTSYVIYRKTKESTSWGSKAIGAISTGAAGATQWKDTGIKAGQTFEYRIIRYGATFIGYGYIWAGIDVPAIEYRGKMILVIDSTKAIALSSEIKNLITDLQGEGWGVLTHFVNPDDKATDVKKIIVADYNNDKKN